MRIDVRGSETLRDAAQAMFDMDRDVQRVVRAYAKSEMVRPWLSEITSRASSTLEHRVISSTSTVAVSNQNVRVQAAAKGRRLSGGLDPKTDYPAVEFGANRGKRKTYTRKGHRVTRRTAVQLKPRRKSGYVFWPAAEEMIPRLAALWVQSIVKGIANVFDGKAF